jgi:hypothetical protein
MGDHKKYFAVVHYWPTAELNDNAGPPTLVLNGGAQELKLDAVRDSPRQVGIAQAIDPSAPSSAKTWLYPVEATALQAIAHSRTLTASLLTAKVDAAYVVWRDGSPELSEFATAFEY